MKMRILLCAVAVMALAGGASAAWYWPFSSGTEEDERQTPLDKAESALREGRLDEARTIYERERLALAGAVGANPVVSNRLSFVRRRIEEIDAEKKRTPPLGELVKPVTVLIDRADGKLDDGKKKEAEGLYQEILTNALPTVVSQNVVRAETRLFNLMVESKAVHVRRQLESIRKEKRLSELMEPVSLKIDEAADLVGDGKSDEAVEKYREALRELERLERENPERAASPEFQSVRNKRAYVDAQLNAILLEEARLNAKSVAVTDTTDLERKLAKKRADEAKAKKRDGLAKPAQPKLESQLGEYMKDARTRDRQLNRVAANAKFERESEDRIAALLANDPGSRKARILRVGLELSRRNYGLARRELDTLFAADPNDLAALNLLAALEVSVGNPKAAEVALMRAIHANRKDHHAYYNLAKILAGRGTDEDTARAKRFYKLGRDAGGPADPKLEEAFE